MKAIKIIFCTAGLLAISVFQSCETKPHESPKGLGENISLQEYDSYSIALYQIDDSQLYVRLKSNSDSLLIIRDKDSIKKERKIFFDKMEQDNFKNIVLECLSAKNCPDTTLNVFGGVGAKFYVEKNNWNLTAKYSRLAGFYDVSNDFSNYLTALKGKINEIVNLNDKQQIDSLNNLMKK